MRIVCISDTHTHHKELDLPPGDVLICAGDFTYRGNEKEIRKFNQWLTEVPYRHRLVVAGNHEFMFERNPSYARKLLDAATYLQDSGTEVDGVRFWGSPWQPWFHDWAFNLRHEEERQVYWDLIPADTDVLITHSPPQGILDQTYSHEHVGCAALRRKVLAIRPRFHVFGHIHEAYGMEEQDGTTYINAAICNLLYKAARPAVVFDVQARGAGGPPASGTNHTD